MSRIDTVRCLTHLLRRYNQVSYGRKVAELLDLKQDQAEAEPIYTPQEEQEAIRNSEIATDPNDKIKNKIPGGAASHAHKRDLDPLALEIGMLHELDEHTRPDKAHIAQEIAADHLMEDPHYYDEDMTPENLAEARNNNI